MRDKKVLNCKNYGSIPHLLCSRLGKGDKYIEDNQNSIATEDLKSNDRLLIVTEKYDGSNVGICKKNGSIIPIIRSGYSTKNAKRDMYVLFENWVAANEFKFNEIISEGERIVCELMVKAHGIKYNYTNDFPIVLIDFFNSNNTRKPFQELEDIKYFKDLVARVIWQGNAIKPSELIKTLNVGSGNMLPSEEMPEGMIYRVESKRDRKVLFMAKWVRDDFFDGQFLKGDILYNKKIAR